MKPYLPTLVLITFFSGLIHGEAYFDARALFPDARQACIEDLIETEEPMVQVDTGDRYKHVGFNFNQLPDFHQEILAAAKGKVIVDCGAGNGYFSAKLLAAGAKQVLAVEMMEAAAQEIPNTVSTYQRCLARKLSGKYKIYKGGALEQLPLIANKCQPDIFCFLNFLHYQTPTSVLEILRNAASMAKEGATLYAWTNAPSSKQSTVDVYLKTLKKRKLFAGYMTEDTVNRMEESWWGLSEIKFWHENVHSLDPSVEMSPVYRWKGFYDPKKHYSEALEDSAEPVTTPVKGMKGVIDIKTTKPIFLLDEPTARYLLEASGWQVVDIYYVDRYADRLPGYDAKLAAEQPMHLCIKAIKKAEDKTIREEL